MENVNLDKIKESLFEVTSSLLSGKEMKKASVRVTVEIPEPLFDAISDLGDQLGVNTDEVFQKLASEGIIEKIKGLISGVQQSIPQSTLPESSLNEAADALKGMGFDLSGLMGGLDKLKGLGTQLQGLEEVIKNAGLAAKVEVQKPNGPDSEQRDAPKDKENTK